MSSFDLEKMDDTINNLAISLDIMLCCNDTGGGQEILESFQHLDNLIMSFDDQINLLNDILTKEKNAQKLSFQKQLDELKMIEERCDHMIVNFSSDFCDINKFEMQNSNQNYEIKDDTGNNLNNMTNLSVSPVPIWNNTYFSSNNTMTNGTMSTTMMGQSLKSQSTRQVFDVQLLKSITNNEMDKVPKYMKGRLSSLNVNVVIDSINAALQNKYDILQKPKNTLKKKDLTMYNTWKIQQTNVGQGQYFVTAEDITKFSEIKVDKTTLNIIPILRHLKRLKESRVGGFVYYLPY